MDCTLRELAQLVGGTVVGDAATPIRGVAGMREAAPGDITFLANRRYAPLLRTTRASAVVVGPDAPAASMPLLSVANPDLAFAAIVGHFNGDRREIERGIHPTAVVDRKAAIGRDVSVGPFCVVEEGASLGDRTVLYPHVYVGRGARVGPDGLFYPMVSVRDGCEIGARVTLHSGCVIGSDGFGYATVDGVHHKIPQTGTVVIEDDVELGACVTVARARFDKTVIRRGTKIDNLVQIAHNVIVGENALIAAQTGIAGTSHLGKNVILGGQVGIGGHLKIGDGSIITAKSGLGKDLPPRSFVSGEHAVDHATHLRQMAALRKLPELLREVKRLRERVEELERRSARPRKRK